MVGTVAGHELILTDAVKDRVDDRPLRRGLLPAALGFFGREANHRAAAQIDLERSVLNKYAAPDNLARFADTLERTPAKREIHGRLALAGGAGIAANKVAGRRSTRNLQQPDKVVKAISLVMLAPANVVQRGSPDRAREPSSNGS